MIGALIRRFSCEGRDTRGGSRASTEAQTGYHSFEPENTELCTTARRHAERKKDFLTYVREVLALISDFQPPGL